MGVSISEYARQRGITEGAVRKALKQGRIVKESDGSIDVERADKAWLTNTTTPRINIANATLAQKTKSTALPKFATDAVRETLAENGQPLGEDEHVTYHHAKEATEILKVEMMRLELSKQKGTLVDCEKVTTHLFQLSRQIRDSWQHWPARIANDMATQLAVDTHTLQIALEKAVRAQLLEICDLHLKYVEEPVAQ